MFDILHPVSGDRLDGVYQARVTRAPAFVVVPELLVSRPETVPPTLLLKVAALVTVPAMAPLLDSSPPLTTAPPLRAPLFVVVPRDRAAHIVVEGSGI